MVWGADHLLIRFVHMFSTYALLFCNGLHIGSYWWSNLLHYILCTQFFVILKVCIAIHTYITVQQNNQSCIGIKHCTLILYWREPLCSYNFELGMIKTCLNILPETISKVKLKESQLLLSLLTKIALNCYLLQ